MNTKFICFVFLVTLMLAFDRPEVEGVKNCSVASTCMKYCWEYNKCSLGKCINKECKCYNCRG
uniref:AKTx n=1 Tax=Hadrurus spadix TaxID=141984 RepID=A0A1W7RB06_9SCOR